VAVSFISTDEAGILTNTVTSMCNITVTHSIQAMKQKLGSRQDV